MDLPEVRGGVATGELPAAQVGRPGSLARTQARGLVERDLCLSDARGAFAVPGTGGLADIERAAPQHVASVRRHLIDVLDNVRLEQLAAIAERVVTHLRGESVCQEAVAAGVPDGLDGSCGLTGNGQGA